MSGSLNYDNHGILIPSRFKYLLGENVDEANSIIRNFGYKCSQHYTYRSRTEVINSYDEADFLIFYESSKNYIIKEIYSREEYLNLAEK